jgi:hypothetical protein
MFAVTISSHERPRCEKNDNGIAFAIQATPLHFYSNIIFAHLINRDVKDYTMEDDMDEINEMDTTDSFVAGNRDNRVTPQSRTSTKDNSSTSRMHSNNEGADEDLKEEILSAWKDVQNEIEFDKAFTVTMTILNKQIEGLIRSGLDAFHRAENTAAELKLLQDELKQKDVEIERHRSAEEKNSTALAVRSA